MEEILGKMERKKLDFDCFCKDFNWTLVWYEGGGVSGGREMSENLCLGVPGWDSHTNGIDPEDPPQ